MSQPGKSRLAIAREATVAKPLRIKLQGMPYHQKACGRGIRPVHSGCSKKTSG
jgi:hypothetical protein